MSNKYFREDGDVLVADGGYGGGGSGFVGGFGGCFAMIVLLVIVLWLLFRSDRNDGYGGGNCNNYGGAGMPYPYPYPPVYPYGGGNCCSPLDCKIPMTPDMSNCEVDRDLWKVDADLLKCCCETKEVTHAEAEATRAVMYADKVEALRDKLAEKNCEVQALKTQQYTDSKFDALYGKLNCYDNENDKQYCKLNSKIDSLICELPKRPPIYTKGSTPDMHDIDCHDYFPKRRGFRDDCGCDKDCCGF